MTCLDSTGLSAPRPIHRISATTGVSVRTFIDALVLVHSSEYNSLRAAIELVEGEYTFWLTHEYEPGAGPRTLRHRERKVEYLGQALAALKAVAP